MFAFRFQQQLLVSLLFSGMALAGQFAFSIQSIFVNETRSGNNDTDTLVLAIASTTNFGNLNQTWPVGKVQEDQNITWSNLTYKIEVPANGSNLSVAIGGFNLPDADDDLIAKVVGGVVDLAEEAPIVGGVVTAINKIFSFFSSYFDCTGQAFLDNIVYSPDFLNGMNQSEKACKTKDYTSDPPNGCRSGNSSYIVTYCLERLDAKPAPPGTKSAAADVLPHAGYLLLFAALAAALL